MLYYGLYAIHFELAPATAEDGSCSSGATGKLEYESGCPTLRLQPIDDRPLGRESADDESAPHPNGKLAAASPPARIAHKAWSELITRKARLQFEPEHDVVVEVYNSWYQLLGEMRSLIKEIPAGHLKKGNTKKLVDILVDSLNKGMGPHLTKWQAKFRRWYEAELKKEENNDKTPQEIQKKYPQYNDMI